MYIMQENTFIIEAYFRSHPFAINHIWNFDVQSRALNLGCQGHFEISRYCHKLKILPA
jgi:hypothetical protein